MSGSRRWTVLCGAVACIAAFIMSLAPERARPDASPAATAGITAQTALERLFTAESISEDWFTPEFLKAVTTTQFTQIIVQIKSQLGAYRGVRAQGDKFRISFARGEDTATINLREGRIAGLFFQAPEQKVANLDAAVAEFTKLPGKVSLDVLADGEQRASLRPDLTLAVGSAFKLAIAAALQQRVDQKRLQWGQALSLQPSLKSLPTGILQAWPDGAQLSVYSLAALMISQSDNTAADMLANYLGRPAVEAFSQADHPMLRTREAFVLKDPKNADLLERWRHGSAAQRRHVLDDADRRALPAVSIFDNGPLAPDVEWFFSARELCGLMQRVADLSFMSITPGVADPGDWKKVAYKGGSEPGVLNFTT
ncbi:MAG: serine hydrolase [Candidatus Eremiobacter antarcticus]|nr:serine hydrolase [Candidatus Eremiobacteraeota bacterium]PZR60818.1 MAG: serine hydrolase [Candidatus Eremiobacter sp. RRmetagenome_bin22]